MNPGELWRLEDGTIRLVLSNATYNSSGLGRVITATVGGPPDGFDPFAVTTESGTVYADRIAMHPRHWLKELADSIGDEDLVTIQSHLSFLICE